SDRCSLWVPQLYANGNSAFEILGYNLECGAVSFWDVHRLSQLHKTHRPHQSIEPGRPHSIARHAQHACFLPLKVEISFDQALNLLYRINAQYYGLFFVLIVWSFDKVQFYKFYVLLGLLDDGKTVTQLFRAIANIWNLLKEMRNQTSYRIII